MNVKEASKILYDEHKAMQLRMFKSDTPNDLRSLKQRLASTETALEASRTMFRAHLYAKRTLEEMIILREMREEEDGTALSAIQELYEKAKTYLNNNYVVPGIESAIEKVGAWLDMPDAPYRRKGK